MNLKKNNEQVPIPPTLPITPHLTLIFLIEIYSFLNCHYSKLWQGVGTSGLGPHFFFSIVKALCNTVNTYIVFLRISRHFLPSDSQFWVQ